MIKTLIKHYLVDHCISIMFDKMIQNFKKNLPKHDIEAITHFSVKDGSMVTYMVNIPPMSRDEALENLRSTIRKYRDQIDYPSNLKNDIVN